eukprot:3634015-Rhodomonas_salina.3
MQRLVRPEHTPSTVKARPTQYNSCGFRSTDMGYAPTRPLLLRTHILVSTPPLSLETLAKLCLAFWIEARTAVSGRELLGGWEQRC